MKSRWKHAGRALLCGALTVFWFFWLAPAAFRAGLLPSMADWVLYPLLVLVAVLIGAALLGRREPAPLRYLWLGLPVQYGLALWFRAPFSGAWGMSLGGLAGFEYLFCALAWPLGLTAAQFLALWLKRRWEEKRSWK